MNFPTNMTGEAKAFVRHWLGLRTAAESVPSSQAFLDAAHPKIQPYMSFNDIGSDGSNVVSLFGTALVTNWGSDITGLQVKSDFPAEIVERYEKLLRTCAEYPAGIWEVSRFATSTGRVITKEITTLPLTIKRPGTIRIARFHRLIETLGDIERVTGLLQSMGREWFDVGAGVPADMPSLKPATAPLKPQESA